MADKSNPPAPELEQSTPRRVTPLRLFAIGKSRLSTKSVQLSDYVIPDLHSANLGRQSQSRQWAISTLDNSVVGHAEGVERPEAQSTPQPSPIHAPSPPPLLVDERCRQGKSCETLPAPSSSKAGDQPATSRDSGIADASSPPLLHDQSHFTSSCPIFDRDSTMVIKAAPQRSVNNASRRPAKAKKQGTPRRSHRGFSARQPSVLGSVDSRQSLLSDDLANDGSSGSEQSGECLLDTVVEGVGGNCCADPDDCSDCGSSVFLYSLNSGSTVSVLKTASTAKGRLQKRTDRSRLREARSGTKRQRPARAGRVSTRLDQIVSSRRGIPVLATLKLRSASPEKVEKVLVAGNGLNSSSAFKQFRRQLRSNWLPVDDESEWRYPPVDGTKISKGSSWSRQLIRLRSDSGPMEERVCFPAVRHSRMADEVIRVGDCVRVRVTENSRDENIGKVMHLHFHPLEHSIEVTLLWFYTREHVLESGPTAGALLARLGEKELLASNHIDTVNVDSIEALAYVLTYNEFCRYNAECRMDQLPPGRRPTEEAELWPRGEEDYRRRRLLPHEDTPMESVYFCRSVYNWRNKRVR